MVFLLSFGFGVVGRGMLVIRRGLVRGCRFVFFRRLFFRVGRCVCFKFCVG